MSSAALPQAKNRTLVPVLGAISFCHLLNDMMQSLLPAIYPILKGGFDLSFAEIGFLTLTYQATASLFQPLVGNFTDRRPQPYSLPVGMVASLLGVLALALARRYSVLLLAAVLLGAGSSIFHPESSRIARIARIASGGRHGVAQSLFQIGGNFGQALGPLLAAFLILPYGRNALGFVALGGFAGVAILAGLGRWYQRQGHARPRPRQTLAAPELGRGEVRRALVVLVALIFSKFIYLSSITSYYRIAP